VREYEEKKRLEKALCDASGGANIAKLPLDYSKLTEEELLAACAKLGDVPAWEEFIRRFHPKIATSVRRVARRYPLAPAGLCDDLAQEVYLKLSAGNARLLREFEPRHPGAAFCYIQVIAANVTHDHFKKRNNLPHPDSVPDRPVPPDAPRCARDREIDDLLREHASENERRIFWLYFRHGLTAKEIAALPFGLSVKGVESVLHRLGDLVRDEFRKKGNTWRIRFTGE
jgi:RNA polymerase sigma-70 factor (ECF subfamily)